MKLSVCAISIALLAASARAEAPERFDLVCTGTVAQMTGVSRPKGETVPWKGRIRVDLGASQFCLDDCRTAENISLVRPDAIIFRMGDAHDAEVWDRILVDRKSGLFKRDHDWISVGPKTVNHDDLYSASCASEEFSGFPKTLF
jgi:hypothetical protein